MATETQTKSGKNSKGSGQSEVIEGLNLLVALAADLRSQVKQAHWTVVGPNFIALHKLFDEQAAILLAHVDLFAERVRALQAIPEGTVRNAADRSTLEEIEIGELNERDAVAAILDRFETYSGALDEAIMAADEAEDLTTQDIYIEAQRAADLQAYFLRSHLPAKGRG